MKNLKLIEKKINNPADLILEIKYRSKGKTIAIYKLNDGMFVVSKSKKIILTSKSEKRAFDLYNKETN